MAKETELMEAKMNVFHQESLHLIEGCMAQVRAHSEARIEELMQKLDLLREEVVQQSHAQLAYFSSSAVAADTVGGPAATTPGQKKKQTKDQRKAPRRKVFYPRESTLTTMLLLDDFKSIFHIAITILIMFGIHLAIADSAHTGGLIDWSFIIWSFSKYEIFFAYWVGLLSCSFLVIPCGHLAATTRGFGKTCSILLYIALQAAFVYNSGRTVYVNQFAPPLAMAVMAEQTRLSMKMHSYWREKMLWDTFGCANEPGRLTDMHYLIQEAKSFFYFIWVPTLLYRKSYPRTARIRWGFVFTKAAECLGIVLYAFVVFRMTMPQFADTKAIPVEDATPFTEMDTKELVLAIFRCMGPGMAVMFLAHFLVLHCTQNLFAELTRFADRSFYSDWWTAANWAQFYRKWNGVVHDFIHAYCYSDLIVFARWSRVAAMLMSFAISAVIHEYAVTMALGFFFPILFVLFGGPGILFIMLTKRKKGRIWNVFMWLMLALGNGLMMVLYLREYYARWNMPGGGFVWNDLPVREAAFPQSWGPFFAAQQRWSLAAALQSVDAMLGSA